MKSILKRLENKIAPSSSVNQWLEVLQATDRILGKLDPKHAPTGEKTLKQWAKEAAATGCDPGDVLADILAKGV